MVGFGTSPLELMAANAMLEGKIYCENFFFSLDWTGDNVLGASATVEVSTQIGAGADFVAQQLNFVSLTGADTFLTAPDYLLRLVIAGSGRQIMRTSQHIVNIAGRFGADQVPGQLPFPRLIAQKSEITGTLQNRTTTASAFAQLTLSGFKVFYTAGSPDDLRKQIFHAM